MKVPSKFVSKLNKDKILQLKQLWKNGSQARIRKRAHGIILSSKGYKIDDIADILEVHRNSVSSWITAKESTGIAGLSDKSRSGAPSQHPYADIKLIEQLLKEFPQSPKTVLAKFAKITNKTASISTLRRIAKKSKLCWKRARKSLKHNSEEFEAAKKEIQKLKEQQQAGKIDLFYFDESGFTLDPIVPYAYQPLGETF
jgi:transposase